MKVAVTLVLLVSLTFTGHSQVTAIDSLQSIVALHRHDSTELNALLHLTDEFSRSDIGKAKSYAHQAISIARDKKNDLSLCNGYLYLVVLHQNSGKIDSATYYLERIEMLLETNPLNLKIRINYNQTAGLFYKNQGLYKKALPYMLDNLNLLTTENESRAGQYLNLGNLYYFLGDFKNAATNHLQALALFEKLKNKRGQSFCHHSLGNDFLSLNQFEKAIEYFRLSFQLKEELRDKRGLITSGTGLGDSYKELGKLDLAKKYYTQALQIAREMKLIAEESRCLFQLGLLHKRMNALPQARLNISAALQLAKQTGDSTLVAKISGEFLGLDFQQKKDTEVERILHSNINTLINSGDRDGIALEYARLSEYYESKNQFDKALYYLKRHEALKDTVEGKAVLLQIKQLEEVYQNEKNKIEIGLLKKEQELQTLAFSRQRILITFIVIALAFVIIIGLLLINRYRVMNRAKRLIEIEKVRNSIARDLHDDIGSTLSSINILSQVALAEQNGSTQNYLKRIGDQSTRMMEDMSDMVWSINPRNDSLDKVIIRMREFATEIFEPAGIECNFFENVKEGLLLDPEKRKNLFFIFKEAINNAAKYSTANKIEIELHQQGHNLLLRVKDNGQGFNEQTVKEGNGLRNLRERANEIKGSVILNSQEGQGTEIELTFPVA